MYQILNITVEINIVVRILLLGFLGFMISMLVTPLYTNISYRGKWWKKPRQNTTTGEAATVFNALHAHKHERNIPTLAGLIFVFATIVATIGFNLERTQTWLPLAAFVGAALIGAIDDIINIRGSGLGVAGLSGKIKLMLISAVSFVGGWFFYAKLGVDSLSIPGIGTLSVGWLIIPLFVLVVVSTANAVNITDGLDGLAGGLCVSAFATYALIAFIEQRYGVSAFCMTIVGGLLSYTWFNIYPARFFMGDVGSFALGTALGVVAMITDTVALLPVIGIVFVAEAGSSVVQIISKKLRNGKKIFKIAPIHHHFEALGWPEAKVTMRFWILGQVASVAGLIIFLIGLGNR